MRAVPGLIGGALALWGFAIGWPAMGIALAIALEVTRFLRPALVPASRTTVALRFTAFAAIAAFGYCAATSPMPEGIYQWLRWLPVVLPVLALAPVAWGPATYAGVVLIAAGTGRSLPEGWFFPAAAALLAWAILANKPWRGVSIVPSLLVALAVAGGFAIEQGVAALQGQVEQLGTDMLQAYFAPRADPFKERTRVGDLGRVKLSDRIAMRVEVQGPRPASLLLREAAFDRYASGEWRTSQRTFHPAARESGAWVVGPGPAPRTLVARTSIAGGEGLLALPAGAHSVSSLAADAVETLPVGTTRARGVPRFVSMAVTYDEQRDNAQRPADADLEVPEAIAVTLDKILATERLRKATPAQTREAIERFFDANFAYSLALGGPAGASRSLSDFLLRDRKGHCEYFATATTLLLRRAGIPARYTVGYSAQEYNERERAFLVRSRHAHAWVSAFVDGRWVIVDTTPARWAEAEEAQARGFLDPLLDSLSWIVDLAEQAWAKDPSGFLAGAAAIVAGILAVIFGILRLRRHLRAPRVSPVRDPAAKAWLAVEKRARKAGFARSREETALAWASRVQRESPMQSWRAELLRLARSYYRVRFDPEADDGSRRAFLDAA
ncbi:MAG TPA: transglutaminase domain-containing protein, partial [Usitatibacter sp.]|nr:transglutaminase domain-containing protein [Usitatibacter sp.]